MQHIQLSIVAVGRNDDYGGDFRSRLQAFISWSFAHLTRVELRSELIFVNYNPKPETSIQSFINWPNSNQWVDVRVITVPTDVHEQIVDSSRVKDVPVLEYMAKNVGIRRAKGKFIMAMNPDIIMSEAIFSKFKQLHRNHYYRANRLDHDLESELSHSVTAYEQLKGHISTIWFKGSHIHVDKFSMAEYYWQWFKKWKQNLWRRNTVRMEFILNQISSPVYYHNVEYRFHCNASGDLMLMHRDNWAILNGYKENSYISLHVDSLMVIQAAYLGLREKVFMAPIYHKQHQRRFDAIGKDNPDQQMVYEQFKQDVEEMASKRKPIIYNDQDWGLAKIQLPELKLG